jgi:hypothetical protein
MSLKYTNASQQELRDENSHKNDSNETAYQKASAAVSDRHGEKRNARLSTMPVLLPGLFSGNLQSLQCCSKAFLYPELPWGSSPTWHFKEKKGKEFLMY